MDCMDTHTNRSPDTCPRANQYERTQITKKRPPPRITGYHKNHKTRKQEKNRQLKRNVKDMGNPKFEVTVKDKGSSEIEVTDGGSCPPLGARPNRTSLGSEGLNPLPERSRLETKNDDANDDGKGDVPNNSGTHRSRIRKTSSELDSEEMYEFSSEFLPPGAQHVTGINGPVSSRSLFSVKSEKDNTEHLMMAVPIDEQDDDDEEAVGGIIKDVVKEKIRADARKHAKDRIKKTAVPAARRTKDDERKEAKMRLRRQCAAGASLFMLFLGGVATAVYYLMFHSPITVEPPAQTDSPTVSPTTMAPTPLNFNDNCEYAFGIGEDTLMPLFGSTFSAAENLVQACETNDGNGFGGGLWYTMSGNDSLMMATTAREGGPRTQISIFQGDSCNVLTCVAGNDAIDSDVFDSQVSFFAESNQQYFIFVHSETRRAGSFELNVEPMEDNDTCEQAITLNSREEIFGSTRGATIDGVGECGTAHEQSAAGVWYSTVGTGGPMSAFVRTAGITAFGGQVSIFSGDDCGTKECLDGSLAGFVTWESVFGETYLILVHGQVDSVGDFVLEVSDLNERPDVNGVGDVCEATTAATVLEVGGSSVTASTRGNPFFEVESCGNGVFSTSAGTWFRVTAANDGALYASTCGDVTDFDTQISVYTGTNECGTLQCVEGNNDDSSCDSQDASSVAWFAREGEEFFILVHGDDDSFGSFELVVEEYTIQSEDTCEEAIVISPDGSAILGLTEGATNSMLAECGAQLDVPGVWYWIEGNGESMTASTCLDESAESSNVVVFTGDCAALECVQNTIDISCGEQSSVSFPTTVNATYYVYVQDTSPTAEARRLQQQQQHQRKTQEGDDETTDSNSRYPSGSFVLTVEDTPSNDLCSEATTLEINGNVEILASTRSATNVGSYVCESESESEQRRRRRRVQITDESSSTNESPRGVWYSVIGDGNEIVASTCSSLTSFETQISVLTGTCSNDNDESLSCTDTVSEPCEGDNYMGSIIRWNSIIGETYHIYVSGIVHDDTDDGSSSISSSTSGSDFGNFALTISSENDKCYAADWLPQDGTIVTGSTSTTTMSSGAITIDDGPNIPTTCDGTTSYITSPGVWYTIIGTGSTMTISTCDERTDYESDITIYRGTCNDLQCIDDQTTSLDVCGNKGTISWESTEDEIYYILVHGYGVGNFGLYVVHDGYTCAGAEDITPELPLDDINFFDSSLSISIDGTTNATSSNIPVPDVIASACLIDFPDLDYESPGRWYVVEGSGTNVRLQLACHNTDGFDFPTSTTRITIFSGTDCSGSSNDGTVGQQQDEESQFTCVNSFSSCDGEVIFSTEFDVSYYILVHGTSEFITSTEYTLSLEQDLNTECIQAASILPQEQEQERQDDNDETSYYYYYDFHIQTRLYENEKQTNPTCGTSIDYGNAGNWYRLIGTGQTLIASTCHVGTDFDTQISVYTGGCSINELTCITGNDDVLRSDGDANNDNNDNNDIDDRNCGTTSEVSWFAESDVTYYIFIHGDEEIQFTSVEMYELTIVSV